MPITVHATEGVFTEDGGRRLFADLTDALLRRNNLFGNTVMRPNVIGELDIIPKGRSFAGGEPGDIVVVQLTVPSFAFSTPEQRQGWVSDATDAVMRASGGRVPRANVWANMTYAVDGSWAIDGKAFSNEELIAAVAAG